MPVSLADGADAAPASERFSISLVTALPVVKSWVMNCGAARLVAVRVPLAPEMAMLLPVPEAAYVLTTDMTPEVKLEESFTLATATTPVPILVEFIPVAIQV